MKLRRYRAACVSEAMAQARAELGSEAILLSTKSGKDGVELTAAVAIPEPDLPPPAPLAWHGVPDRLADQLAPPLATSLAALFRFESLPLGHRALLLVGPPGAGKTLAIARLATRLVLAGTLPCVITADGRRAGAAEELAAYTRLLRIKLTVASEPETLARALRRRAPEAPVLIDSAGSNPLDAAELEAVAALAAISDAVPVLVLPAGQHPDEAAEQAAAFGRIGVRHLLATRLDIARRLGSLLAAAAQGLAFTEAGTGPGAQDMSPLTPLLLAERLSTGPERP